MIDGERTRPPQTEAQEKEGVDRVARLPSLVDALASAPPDDKPALASELNRLLIAMRAPGQEGAEAAVVLAALGAHQLDGAVDTKGRSCRKEAVDTLLATGFPHALQVAPEDLEFARAYRRPDAEGNEWEQKLRANRGAAAFAGTVCSLATIVPQLAGLGGEDGWRWVSVAAALLVAGASFWLSRREPDTRDQAPFGTAMALGAIVQFFCVVATGPWAIPALTGAVLALLFAFAGQYVPDPRKY